MRRIVAQYRDPLDLVWLETARRLDIEIRRDPSVFATWDGRSVLTIGTPETLDADDCLAQLIFHELCHALVEGPAAHRLPDWGLENRDARHEWREHACLRLQAALAGKFGLRELLAATTGYRNYYDRLPSDPLQGDDAAVEAARVAWQRATEGPWATTLERALEATAAIANAVAPFAPSASLWHICRPPDAASKNPR